MECLNNNRCCICIKVLYLLSILVLTLILISCVSSSSTSELNIDTPPQKRNSPPVPTASAILTTVNTPGTTQIDVNDHDGDQIHTFTIDTSPEFGDVTVNLTGHVEYVPVSNFTGDDRTVIRVTDSGDPPLSSLVVISIIVSAESLHNSPPMPIAAPIFTVSNVPGVTQIDPNDSDTDQNHTFSIFTSPEHGTAEVNSTGVARYEPDSGFSGSDGFVVSVTDSGSPPLRGTVFISVTVDLGTQMPESIWQIGIFHGSVNPFTGAEEFEKGIDFFDVYRYDVDLNSDDEINSPNFPGYLFTKSFDSIPLWTAREVNIQFTLDRLYNNTILRYDRYGSEGNDILLDGGLITSIIGPGESMHKSFPIPLGTLRPGVHTVIIRYTGGGDGRGHYIDALSLSGTLP